MTKPLQNPKQQTRHMPPLFHPPAMHWLQKILLITFATTLCSINLVAANITLTLSCTAENDLFRTLSNQNIPLQRFADPISAIDNAPPGTPVLILADGYPKTKVAINQNSYDLAKTKNLRLYVEYPAFVPGLSIGDPKTTLWERLVISSDQLGPTLPKQQIMVAHQCYYLPATAASPLLVVAKVAGYNNAVYGIPTNAQPILFSPATNLLVATTKLSHFITGRYAPQREWTILWQHILRTLGASDEIELKWQPLVTPALLPTHLVNQEAESNCFRAAVDWTRNSGLLVPKSDWDALVAKLKKGEEVSANGGPQWKNGDGTYGILEGYASQILPTGHQRVRWPLRADCQAESAMLFALDGSLNNSTESPPLAHNLLDFLYEESGMHGGVRGNPEHPAFGLIGWGAIAPAWEVATYGDDNARAILATIVSAAALQTSKWDKALLKALLANLRTTGKLGFRGDRIDIPQLEKNGWKHFHDASTVSYSPHFEAYSWACFLWAYQHTKYKSFLDRTKTAIRMTMDAYPSKWRWNDNMERAHMLLALCWLVRLEDTPEHREWTRKVAAGLMEMQDKSGAFRERMLGTSGGHYQRPRSNEDYGTNETPLMHEKDDPVSDQLYVAGFALLGLHEAALTLKDDKIADASDKLAAYLCRIQNRSDRLPYLNGSWFRAFDFERWEPWASSGDIGWGAWSIEAGWAQAWGAAIIGLRRREISVWDFIAKTEIAKHWDEVNQLMARSDGRPFLQKK